MAYNAETMSFDVPDTDMVYVSGLPQNITEDEIAEHFGTIGILKVDKKKEKKKIWLYRDKATGALKAGLAKCPQYWQAWAVELQKDQADYDNCWSGRWHCVL